MELQRHLLNPYSRDRIDTWVADYCDSLRYASIPDAAKEYAAQILVTLLVRACEDEDLDPGSVSEKGLRRGLLEGVASLQLPESIKSEVPGLCRSLLEELGDQGRLGGGARLGRYVWALRSAYLEAASARPKPIVSVTSKVGRNDPCPCGSGRKYKKCCMGLLDSR